MSKKTTHTIDACIGIGDPDHGAECDLRITYTFLPGAAPVIYPADNADPGSPNEIEFVKCVQIVDGKERPRDGAFADLEQDTLNTIAEAWLEGDEGSVLATERAHSDCYAGLDAAEEARADARMEDL
jgi:hypothetical protein